MNDVVMRRYERNKLDDIENVEAVGQLLLPKNCGKDSDLASFLNPTRRPRTLLWSTIKQFCPKRDPRPEKRSSK